MDILDRSGLAQGKQIVVALLVAGAADELVAAKMILVEFELLDLGAHRPVENQDALSGGLLKGFEDFSPVAGNGFSRTKQIVGKGHTFTLSQIRER